MFAIKSIRPVAALTAAFAQIKSGMHLSSSLLVSKEFEEAKTRLGQLSEDPGNDVKLKIYALFKQVKLFLTPASTWLQFLIMKATVGPCNTPKPSMVDFVNRAKWTAWSELKSLSQVNIS